MFFRPELLNNTSMEQLLRGLSQNIAKKRDGTLIDSIRNLLITAPENRHINMDLFSLNIQRARDHGLEKFNKLRTVFDL